MAAHLDDPELHFDAAGSDGPRFQSPPRAVVRVAAVIIAGLAVVGLARGIMAGRPAGPDASPLSVLTGLNSAAAANAKPATMLPRDDGWSTLSGPQLVDSSAKPKAGSKPAASNQDQADSGSTAAEAAAADAIAPDAPDAAPAAQAASSTAATPPPPNPAPEPAGPPPGV
jgi:hypothetical protein